MEEFLKGGHAMDTHLVQEKNVQVKLYLFRKIFLYFWVWLVSIEQLLKVTQLEQ